MSDLCSRGSSLATFNSHLHIQEEHTSSVPLTPPPVSASFTKTHLNQRKTLRKKLGAGFPRTLPSAALSSHSLLFWTTTENEGNQMMEQKSEQQHDGDRAAAHRITKAAAAAEALPCVRKEREKAQKKVRRFSFFIKGSARGAR